MPLRRLLVIVLGVVALLWVVVFLALSTVLAHPTGDSGEGRFPGRTVTGPNP